jgi:hypothetical protein
MIEQNIKDLEVKWLNDDEWKKMRDFLILKMQEANTEEKFNSVMEALIGSLFRNVDELDKARKDLQLAHITEKEKRRINKFVKEAEEDERRKNENGKRQ